MNFAGTACCPLVLPAFHSRQRCIGDECTDLTDPTCTCSDNTGGHWSSTSLAPLPTWAWTLIIDLGFVWESGKTSPGTVRAVRRLRFVDNADGTITDRRAGLMWEKKVKQDATQDLANLHDVDNAYPAFGQCSAKHTQYCQPNTAAAAACTAGVDGDPTGGQPGQQPCEQCGAGEGTCIANNAPCPGGTCVPVVTMWDWLLALNAANFAGHNDWRLPTLAELESIGDYAGTTCCPMTHRAFHNQQRCNVDVCADLADRTCSCSGGPFDSAYYSATWGDMHGFWSIDFRYGDIHHGVHVRAVRAGR